MRIGLGYDSHRLVKDRKLVIGGIEIPFSKGLKGHSDGDVLVHAIIDSIIGALGEGDIGRHFPDSDPEWKDASSLRMLKIVLDKVQKMGFMISMVDSTVITEEPRLAPYIPEMIKKLQDTGLPRGRVNIKAKTNESMGFVGRGEGIVAMAVCLLTEIC
ncbi:MAG: 2-C-methyl-D-erythritol 2,4-cyclodiphosphate synthase [Nitrospirae bacterium]|nr:2-C-methyl-D-erythritol 2,4-cyclodiphosphate synthase [Nitrospirota bacterium]